jgi:hypothetical protein
MIEKALARIEIDGKSKEFESTDIDDLIAKVDSYLVSMK